MGGLVIERIRPGVEFVPDAAAAFRRADARVRAEFGRGIDVNSTYRSWSDQMEMFEAWNRYVASGFRPALKPNHSKAVHPSESFHVAGTALDSDDWVNARIVAILAENGFIRNRLYVPNEKHHFEYIRSRDKNYGKPTVAALPPEKQGDITMRVIYNTQNKDERSRRAVVGELTFHVQGAPASTHERKLWGDVENVTNAGWISALNMVNTRRAMNGLKPLKGIRGEFSTPTI